MAMTRMHDELKQAQNKKIFFMKDVDTRFSSR